jgi:hypothetical protein
VALIVLFLPFSFIQIAINKIGELPHLLKMLSPRIEVVVWNAAAADDVVSMAEPSKSSIVYCSGFINM